MDTQKDSQFFTLKDIWETFTNNLVLFVVSIIITMSVGFVIIITSTPIYQRTTSILIKSSEQSNPLLEGLGLGGENADIKNEIQLLSNPELIYEVITDLNLDKTLEYKQKNLRWIDLYANPPLEIKLDNQLSDKDISLKLRTDKHGEFKITRLKICNEKIKIKGLHKFNQEIKTPHGSFVINKTGQAKNLVTNHNFRFTKTNAKTLARDYAKILEVALRDNSTSIIDLSLSLGSTIKADEILNTLIEFYNRAYLDDANLVNESTRRFIDERLVSLEKELSEVDKNISRYKSENLIVDFSVTAGLNQSMQNENQRKLIELSNSLAMACYIQNFILANQDSFQLLPVSTGLYSSSLEAQINKYNESLLHLNYLERNSGANNPLINNAIQELKSLKHILLLSIDDYINTLKMQINKEEKNQQKNITNLSNTPHQELYLLSKTREQKIKEELYLFLLQKKEENAITKTFTNSNTKILGLSTGEELPDSPQIYLIIILSFIVGLVIPTLIIIIRTSLDSQVKTKEDLDSCLIPYLGYIPSIINKTNNKRRNPSEAFKVLRANLDFITSGENQTKITQLISMHPASGKTLICANLAKCISLKGSRVIIIDCDMRVAAMSKLLDMPRRGLANILNGNVENYEDVIIKNAFNEGLDAIAVGVLPPNPAELLLNKRFERLITSLKGGYDYIFIDCPPVEIVSDSSIVAKFCTNTIFVVRAGLFDKRSIPELNRIYGSNQYKNLSLVLNDVAETPKKQYGGYAGYGKKYGENPDDNSSNIIGFD